MNFAYSSNLDSNKLRLLQPAGNYGDSPILRFRLHHVQRASKPPYTAVSYTWGDGDASELIYLDDRPFRVRPNLWSCLHYLSRAARDADVAWRYLWVDAICINQADTAERSAQVRRMDQTYRDAVCVSAWLGLVPLPDDLRHASTSTPIKTLESDAFDFADAMLDVANRPYWSRVWVIQEFLLARDVEIYCSDNRIAWPHFQEILSREADVQQFYDADHELTYSVSSGGRRRRSEEFAALSLVMGRHSHKHLDFLQPLCDVLVDHRDARCTDPRDKVFGLLGLILPEEREVLGRYFPDYALSAEHVRIITLAHLTQFRGSSQLSRMARRGEEIGADSEDVFAGLAVVGAEKAQRRRLLERAGKLVYLAGMPTRDLLFFLRYEDEMEECEAIAAVRREERKVAGLSRSRGGEWLRKSVGVISAIVVVWLIVKGARMSRS